jgi:Relaxase/Mobilisation nuclease domain
VIIKGTSCAGASRLTTHLTRTDTNERAEVIDIRGVVADNLSGALHEMEAVAAGARTTKPFYHGSINTRADERLTDEQRMYAIDRLEATLGLTGQARVVVIHEKEGREHCHIVWSRIDLDRMAAISDSNNYRKHEEVARSLEREFGHERVQGALVEREQGQTRANPQPPRNVAVRTDGHKHRSGQGADDRDLEIGQERKGVSGGAGRERLDAGAGRPARFRGDRSAWRRSQYRAPRRGSESSRCPPALCRPRSKKLSTVAEAKQVQRQRHGSHERQAAGKHRVSEARPPRKAAGQAQGSKPARGPRLRPSPGKVADALFSALMGEKPAPKPKEADKPPHVQEAAQPSQRRQELMRQLSREIPSETERDAEIERDRGRERDRG